MVKSSPGVNPKPRFGPILDSTAPSALIRTRIEDPSYSLLSRVLPDKTC